jgi:hypothetical protein
LLKFCFHESDILFGFAYDLFLAHSWNMAESADAEAAPAKKAKTAAK